MESCNALNRKIYFKGITPKIIFRTAITGGAGLLIIVTAIRFLPIPLPISLAFTAMLVAAFYFRTKSVMERHMERIKKGHPSSHESEKVKALTNIYIADLQAIKTLEEHADNRLTF